MQPRWLSAIETIIGNLLAFFIAVQAQRIIFPLYGIQVDPQQNYEIVIWFTMISMARGYVVRRFFNWLHGYLPFLITIAQKIWTVFLFKTQQIRRSLSKK